MLGKRNQRKFSQTLANKLHLVCILNVYTNLGFFAA